MPRRCAPMTTLRAAGGAAVRPVRRCRARTPTACSGPGPGAGRPHRGGGGAARARSPGSSASTGGRPRRPTARCWTGPAGRCGATTRWTPCAARWSRPARRRIATSSCQVHAAAGAARSRAAAGGIRPGLRRRLPAASARCCRSPARRWSRSTCAWPARCDEMVELPVPTMRLAAGTRGAAEDVHMARVQPALVRGEVVHRPAEAVGMQLQRPLAAGQPLAVSELMRPAMVQKGASVLVMLDSARHHADRAGPGAGVRRARRAHPGAEPGLAHAVVEAEVIGPGRVRGRRPTASPARSRPGRSAGS